MIPFVVQIHLSGMQSKSVGAAVLEDVLDHQLHLRTGNHE